MEPTISSQPPQQVPQTACGSTPPPTPVSPPPVKPELVKKYYKWLIAVVVIFLLATSGFLFYQNQKLATKIKNAGNQITTASNTKTCQTCQDQWDISCPRNTTCVLADWMQEGLCLPALKIGQVYTPELINLHCGTKYQPSPTPDQTANWKTYQNSTFGFSFLYPQELTLYDQLKQVGDNLLLQNFKDIPGRKENSSDFQLVLFINQDDGKALEEYPKSWEEELGKLPTEKLLIDGVNAIGGYSGQKYQAVPTVWIKNSGYLYNLQLSTPESTNKEFFDQILSTLTFTN